MASSSLHRLLWSVILACSAASVTASAEEVLRYAGKAEMPAPVGHSCYPDMPGVVDISLLLVRTSESSRGYLVIDPGFAVEVERPQESEVWTITTLPVGESRTPFFLPKQIRTTGSDVELAGRSNGILTLIACPLPR
ncbi:MAG: hypothetical protein ABJA83_08715 [Burkholderiaceae bacterium]